MPLISVIIPVYNVEKYLNECVDSVINQTYKNLEIILVDDGSTDSSGKICDEYAKMDSRVIVIHKENGGLSSARNAGLDIFTGDYVTFLDSDDYFEYDAVEFLYCKEIETAADVITCLFYLIYKNGCIKKKEHINENLLKPEEAFCEIMEGEDVVPAAWGKLYKRKVFNNLRYCEGILYEDTQLIPQLIKNIDTLYATTEPKIYYRQRKSSIMFVKVNKKILDLIFVYKHCFDAAIESFPSAVRICKLRYYNSFFLVLEKILKNGAEFGEEFNEVVKGIKKNFWGMFFFSGFSLMRRFSLIIMMFSPKKYVTIYKKVTDEQADDKEYFD